MVPSAEKEMLRLLCSKLLASWLPEVWKFWAKVVTTPWGVIRRIRPPTFEPPWCCRMVRSG